jgi:hypothetical protein
MLSEEQLRSGRKHGEIRGEPLSLLSITSRFYYKKTPTKCTLRVISSLEGVSPALNPWKNGQSLCAVGGVPSDAFRIKATCKPYE